MGRLQKPLDLRSADTDASSTNRSRTNGRALTLRIITPSRGDNSMPHCIEGLPDTVIETESETSAAVARSRRLRPRARPGRCMCVGPHRARARRQHQACQSRLMQSSRSAQLPVGSKRKPNGVAGRKFAGNTSRADTGVPPRSSPNCCRGSTTSARVGALGRLGGGSTIEGSGTSELRVSEVKYLPSDRVGADASRSRG